MFKKYRRVILVMLFFAAFINYIDRAALSIAAPYISNEFHLTPADMGFIFSSFFVGYALFNFVGGYLADIFGPRKTFGIAMSFWSFFGGLTAFSFNFSSLYIVRVLFGLGEGPIGSANNKTINNWFPASERARAVGISTGGMSLGAALTGPIVGFMALHWGWKTPFVVIMLLGFVWTFFWLKYVSDRPRDNSHVSTAELQEIEQGQVITSEVSTKASLGYFLKQPTILATAAAFFASNYILYFFLTWFPSYLVMAHGLSIKDMALVSAIPWLIGFIGQVGGGFISDLVYKKTGNLMFSRKVVIVVCLLGSALGVSLGGLATSTVSAVLLMSLTIFCQYLTTSNYWAIIQDTVRGENVGGVGGFVHFLSNLAGIVGPALTGILVQSSGSFTSAFLLAGALAVVAALAVAFAVKPITD
ncbi:ACS family hexuronate transporter-like MFS transporter [Sporomusaceae bacterium BoRhaA]|uniref:MFS transporter n=1 Tax=Pelorhabdus rhamnosifermentans TaxID=2772457 RepID=UPI001C0643A1|nr:MFS transporter [Pelorhabdus rhamnosifermentans]MBU2702778.1 ACS family hexuronate transporter-like MFS transporter [Pelorhabdus rhamnosifermentans]